MEFWNKKIGVSEEAARMQVAIINKFDDKKRLQIALDFANMGVDQTRAWVKERNPNYSSLELTLEFVRLMYYEKGEMEEKQWLFFKNQMDKKIRKDWTNRFRKMMNENNWDYDDVAKLGDFKNGKVIEATISRGLPAFAKLAVLVHELKGH